MRRLSGYHFDDASWNYIPVHDPGTGLVDAILAIAKPDATIGDNLNTVMFIRNGNEFEAWSWRNTTRGRAVYSAKMILNVSDEDDANWLLEEELPWRDDNAVRPPVPYMAGMLTDDPLFEPVVESNDPQALLDMLASLGYPVTANRPEGGGESNPPCPDQAEVLLRMTGGTEWGLTQTIVDEASSMNTAAGVAQFLKGCSGPPCNVGPTGPAIAVPAVCTGASWIYDGSTPAPGGIKLCNYHVRSVWFESQSVPYMFPGCIPGTCNQSHYGYSTGGTASCLVISGPCPSTPPCATGPLPGACGPGAITWNNWSPQCP